MKLLSIILLLGSLLFADYDEHEHEYEYKRYHLPMDMSYLDLSPDQFEEARIIVKRFKHEHQAFHREDRIIREAIAELFIQETFDRDTFVRLTGELKQRAVAIEAAFFADMHAILTPRQKARFVTYMKEWKVE